VKNNVFIEFNQKTVKRREIGFLIFFIVNLWWSIICDWE